MGRLTLNVLLSFAQFEREVTGERIRDKIAASKRKGMWMGGIPPLGYRPHERTLIIDEAEAVTVRLIFERYLALGSVHALKDELDRSGLRSRPTKRCTGEEGPPFSRGALYYLLSNRLYLGEIVHKEHSFPGLHPAIVEQETFDRVQTLLAANRHERQARTVTVAKAPLTGRLFDSEGRPLCPVTSRNSRGRVYRYYVSAHLQQGGRRSDDSGLRVPAPTIEATVLSALQFVVPTIVNWNVARGALKRVEVEHDWLTITAQASGRVRTGATATDVEVLRSDDGLIVLQVPFRLASWAGSSQVTRVGWSRTTPGRPGRSLVRGIARSHQLVRKAKANPTQTIEELGGAEGLSASYVRRLSRLAFLAPDIQQAIVDGEQPSAVNLERLMRLDLPLSWQRQRELLAFAL
jgi:hypothetical protein